MRSQHDETVNNEKTNRIPEASVTNLKTSVCRVSDLASTIHLGIAGSYTIMQNLQPTSLDPA